MISSTVLGLLLFVGSVTPGYVWVRTAERHRPRSQRSAVMELAELSLIGALATSVAALIVFTTAREWKGLQVDVDALARTGGEYLLAHPLQGFGTLLALLLLSIGLVLAASGLAYRGKPPIAPGYATWDRLFKIDDPAGAVHATVELRDGRRFSGYVWLWDIDPQGEHRRLALHGPIHERPPGGRRHYLGDDIHFVSFSDADIVWVSVTQDPSPFAALQDVDTDQVGASDGTSPPR